MDTAMLLASIFGPLLGIVGLWMLLYSDNLLKVVNSIKGSPGLLYTGAVINLLVGLTIVTQYNVWSADLSVFLTLLGWVQILRGVLVLFIPQVVIKTTMTHLGFVKVMGIIPLIWGLLLCWFAFF
jgi:hypothetical protein